MYVVKHGRDFAFPDYKPNYPPSPPYKIKHLYIELKVYVYEGKIAGIAKHKIVVKEDTSKIELDAVDMNIHKVKINGKDAQYVYDGKKLYVFAEDKFAKDESIELEVEYSAKPKKGLYFIEPKNKDEKPMVWSQGESEDNRYWIPTYDFPNMRYTVELKIHAPKDLKVFANGELVETREEDEWTVWYWKLDKPIPSYLIALAIGNFDVKEEKVGDLKLIYAVPRGRGEDIDRSFSKTPDMIRFFEELTGVKYPWGSNYKQICVKEFIVGGMENASITLLTDRTLHDEKAHEEFESEPLVSHELAHQWFGDLVTTKDWGNIWLNESFATYLEALYTRHYKGEEEFIYELIRYMDTYLREYSSRYSRPIVTRVYKYPTEVFDAHSYPKGALVLHTLHNLIGEEKFKEFLKAYLEKHKFSNADTEDLRKALEEVTGEDFEWFFDQYVYNAGHPVLTVSHTYDSEKKVLRVTIKQTQGEDCWETYRLPIEIRVKPKNGDFVEYSYWLEEKEQTFYIPLDSPPEVVCVDPRLKILAKIVDKEEIEFLINKTKLCGCVYCKIRAIRSLGKQFSDKAVEALESVLLNDKEFWGVRYEAARALGEIGTRQAKQSLLKALDIVKNPRVRRGIVQALGTFKDEKVAEALAKILDNREEGYYVRAFAAESLGKTKWEKAIKHLKKHKDDPSHNNVITIGVLRGLANLGTDEAFRIILEYTKSDKPTLIRAEAIRLMGKFNEKREAREIILNALRSEDMRIRSAGLAAIAETMDSRYIPALNSLIDRELHDGLIRRAREIIRNIQRFMEKGTEYQKLREELEKIKEEQRKLYDELARLEAKSAK